MLDHSGFRIHYTRKLRPEDGGMLISGVSVSDTQMIPPQQKLYRNVGICGPSCTSVVSKYVYSTFIGVFGALLLLGGDCCRLMLGLPFVCRCCFVSHTCDIRICEWDTADLVAGTEILLSSQCVPHLYHDRIRSRRWVCSTTLPTVFLATQRRHRKN